jgi:hypothetical protein
MARSHLLTRPSTVARHAHPLLPGCRTIKSFSAPSIQTALPAATLGALAVLRIAKLPQAPLKP